MTPYLEDHDFTLFQGDALETLRTLPDESVHMCVTSPPFYGLRDYGTGAWEGGDEGCDHKKDAVKNRGEDFRKRGEERGYAPGSNFANYGERNATASDFEHVCGKCGARRVDQQIGLEATPDEWVARLVEVFREVRRVLRRDGTCWVEIGDSYASNPAKGESGPGTKNSPTYGRPGSSRADGIVDGRSIRNRDGTNAPGCKPKDLVGAPWLLAFALRADGWYLRSDIVWARPNPMPESVRDRPSKSHSYVFLLSKSPRYFFDAEAVREPHNANTLATTGKAIERGHGRQIVQSAAKPPKGDGDGKPLFTERWLNPAGRNLRSLWTIATEPLPDEHYAAFPQKLVERCILAGTSERGVCPECGAPWERVSERIERDGDYPTYGAEWRAGSGTGHGSAGRKVNPAGGSTMARYESATSGWQPTCTCAEERAKMIERTVKAGTSERGVCPECGAPWERVVEHERPASRDGRVERLARSQLERSQIGSGGISSTTFGIPAAALPGPITTGWQPTCACLGSNRHLADIDPLWCPVPAVVLDPFLGSGTTALVARRLGRRCVGIELSETYCRMAARRTQQLSLIS